MQELESYKIVFRFKNDSGCLKYLDGIGIFINFPEKTIDRNQN